MADTNLRARLIALRADAFAQLAAADTIDAGLLALAADAGTALAVLDATAVAAPQGDRAVIVDDGERIVLASYSATQRAPMASITLSPLGAIRLAGDLSAAAARHLARGTP